MHAPSEYRLDAAIRELERHRIQKALVCARAGALYRHEVGNDEAFGAAASHNGLLPVATVNPVQDHGWQREAERARAAGAVAFRLFPDVQGWPLEAMPGGLQRPVLVPVTRSGDAEQIGARTARAVQPVILLGAHYTQLSDCLSALEHWPHLFLETSRLGQFRGVETVVDAVGAERLLFGSGCPVRPIQAALNAVLTARISESEKRLILSGNAERMFGVSVEGWELPEAVRIEGLIDVHTHVGAVPYQVPKLDSLEGYGIRRALASSIRAIMTGEPDDTGEYAVLNPNDRDGACRALRRPDVLGFKLHCQYSGQPTASRQCRELLHEVASTRKPLKIHVAGSGWDQALIDVAAAHPEWPVIIAHGGPGLPVLESAGVVEQTDNVYVELSTTAPDLPVIREVVRLVGSERLLFGSDAPLIDPAYVLGIYADAGADLPRTRETTRAVFNL
jgi:predicted TIM-barrel fold metal-dependent hydrolase